MPIATCIDDQYVVLGVAFDADEKSQNSASKIR